MSDIPSESDRVSADQTELERLLRKSKPWFDENATTLIYALAALLAAAAVFVYVNRTPSGNVSASRDLLLAVSPEDFGDVADSYPESDIGLWSRLRQADRLLDDGVTNLFKDRERGVEELERAGAAFDRLATRTDLPDELRERVLIGLARLAETKCNGDNKTTGAAIAAWQRVLDEFSDSIMKDHAEARVTKLATDESKAFYKWFAAQNPKPALSNELAPGQPAVPGVPPKSISEMFGDSQEAEEEKTPEDGATKSAEENAKPEAADAKDEKEPAGTEAKDSENSAGDKPAEEPAATDAKPADEPATEEPASEKPAEANKADVPETQDADK